MPNRRITIILNSNQTKRITVLVPLPVPGDAGYNIREHILLQAKNKFLNKYLSIVYRWGGEELKDGDVLPDKEEEVLVSKGEAYIGPPKKQKRTDGRAGEVRVLANTSFIHEDVSILHSNTRNIMNSAWGQSGDKTTRGGIRARRRIVRQNPLV